jgi:hypothetical protein
MLLFAAAIAGHGGTIYNLSVSATADIYSAGQSSLPATLFPGTFAPAVGFAAGPSQVLSFLSVTGQVGCNFVLTNGPDGTCFPGVNTGVTSYGGLSGISALDANMFLVGVFLNTTTPSGAGPAVLSYNFGTLGSLTTGDSTYQPALDQVFFIGDGLTGTGTGAEQQFAVPTGATRLYLGFADSFDSVPSFYADDVGSLNISLQIASAVPETATFLLLGAGLLLIGLMRRGSDAEPCPISPDTVSSTNRPDQP